MVATKSRALLDVPVGSSREWRIKDTDSLYPTVWNLSHDVGTTADRVLRPCNQSPDSLRDLLQDPGLFGPTTAGRALRATSVGALQAVVDVGLIGEGLQSFDSTTAWGEPDPVWLIAEQLAEDLVKAKAHAQYLGARVRHMEALHAAEGTTDEDDGDVLVFGPPKRKVRVQVKVNGRRREKPLIVAEDFGE